MKMKMKLKKAAWLLAVCGLLLSLSGLSASAYDAVIGEDWPQHISVTPGNYACANPEDFSPVGEVKIKWVPDAASHTDMTDGDIADWWLLGLMQGFEPLSITETNMVSWVGGRQGVRDPGMPGDWGVKAYFMADADYVYMIFDVTDSDFAYGQTDQGYNGDALQLSIDFGGRLEDILRNEPDYFPQTQGIFYSFSCEGDGAPIRIMRQESDQDGLISEANGDGIKGATRRTETGWSAEIAFSWDQLFNDYSWKAWDDTTIYYGGDAEMPIKLNMALTYINRTEEAGEITWAASTTRGSTWEGSPVLSWTALDNGMKLVLPFEYDMNINCDHILRLYVNPVLPPEELEVPCTEPIPEVVTEPAADTAPPTIPVEPPASVDTTVDTAVEGLDPELNAILEKYGCAGTLGVSAILLPIAAAAWVLKKKD